MEYLSNSESLDGANWTCSGDIFASQSRVEDMLKNLVEAVDEIRVDIATLSRSPTSKGLPQKGRLRSSSISSVHSDRKAAVHRNTSLVSTTSFFDSGKLASEWPQSLEPRIPEVEECDAFDATATTTNLADRMSTALSEHLALNDGEAKVAYWSIDPNSPISMLFDMLSIVVLLFDLTLLPIVLAWDLEIEGSLLVCAWVTMIFWTVDIFRSFVTGIFKDGHVNRDLKVIARSYLRTWFVMDLIVVSTDWLSIGIGSPSGFKTLRIAKLGRMLRILGMLRMLRVVRVMEEFAEIAISDSVRLGFRIMMIICGIMWLTHMMCCAWYAMGRWLQSDTDASWVDMTIINGKEFLELSYFYQYLTSFHWAVAQLTLGAVEVVCTNSVERIYNVLCMLVGLIFGSALISSLSATMVELQSMKKDQTDKLRVLRRFLRENEVNGPLTNIVQRQVVSRLNEQMPLCEKDVPALSLLSSSLREELHYAICERGIRTNPLFRLWTNIDATAVSKFCLESVDFVFLSAQDDLFSPSTSVACAYYLEHGRLDYIQDMVTAKVTGKWEVHPGSWLCLAALWSEWTHVGQAVAVQSSKLMRVDHEGISQVMRRSLAIGEVTKQYARLYLQRTREAHPPDLPYPSDIQVPYTDYEGLVSQMSKEAQVIIGHKALKQLALRRSMWTNSTGQLGQLGHISQFHLWDQTTAHKKLRQEVESGQTLLMENGDGEIKRVVSVIALRIEWRDSVFARIGVLEGGVLKAKCELPGCKQERRESCSEALDRYIRSKMPQLSDFVTVEHRELQVTEKESQEYGVVTKYLRTVFHTELTGEIVLPVRHANKGAIPHLTDELVQRGVYVLGESSGKTSFYALLSEAEMQQLSAPGAEVPLRDWLEALEDVGLVGQVGSPRPVANMLPEPSLDEAERSDLGSSVVGAMGANLGPVLSHRV